MASFLFCFFVTFWPPRFTCMMHVHADYQEEMATSAASYNIHAQTQVCVIADVMSVFVLHNSDFFTHPLKFSLPFFAPHFPS